jgi:hypothetical protein
VLDRLQPEQGNEQLWVVRGVQGGAVLGAANLQQASAPFLEPLRPIRQAGLPVLGILSDAQGSIRVAVANVVPGVPHQLCPYHALHEATEPLWEADRHLLVEAKKELGPLRDVEERTRRPGAPEPTDSASSVPACFSSPAPSSRCASSPRIRGCETCSYESLGRTGCQRLARPVPLQSGVQARHSVGPREAPRPTPQHS